MALTVVEFSYSYLFSISAFFGYLPQVLNIMLMYIECGIKIFAIFLHSLPLIGYEAGENPPFFCKIPVESFYIYEDYALVLFNARKESSETETCIYMNYSIKNFVLYRKS